MHKSKEYFEGESNSYRRSLYKAMGFTSRELTQHHIGVVNTWSEVNPGHYHLRRLSEAVKAGIRQKGGTPFEFNLFSTCGGIALGTRNMRYELPIRDVLAASVEIMSRVHLFDGLVLLASCDNIIPGLVMGALRLNIPSILVTGGPMMPGRHNNTNITQADMDELVFAYRSGKIEKSEIQSIEDAVCPGCGACPVMGTANTMQILSEAMGITLSGTSTIPANSAEKIRSAKLAGEKINDLIENSVTPERLISRKNLENAAIVDLAIGGSTNAILHLLAYAYELDIDLGVKVFEEYSKEVPLTCNVKPSGTNTVIDLHEAGGVPAIANGLKELIDTDTFTVDEKSLGESLKDTARSPDMKTIFSAKKPFKKESGLAILKGNICPNGAVVRTSSIKSSMLEFEGPAKIFDSDLEASKAVQAGEVSKGEVIVIRYQGPSGGPGMNEIMSTPLTLIAESLDDSVALITDGRFSGFNRGPIIGHLSPEAARGGALAIIEEGDIIHIDIENRLLEAKLSRTEMEKRMSKWSMPNLEERRGYLNAYSKLALPAEKGAVLDIDFSN